MSPWEARRCERIAYRAPVELLAYPEGGEIPCRVLARTLDLGAGGMQLCAPVQMAIGSAVTCRVELDGRPASLPGRVAWQSHHDASTRHGEGHGMGICFDRLGSYESALLQRVVQRSSGEQHPVALWLAGLQEPVRARARAHPGGLQLSATLPILARGSELMFRLDEGGPLFRGRLGDARLCEEEGERRIEVEVQVGELDGARFRRYACLGEAEPASQSQVVGEAAAGAAASEPEPTEAADPVLPISAWRRVVWPALLVSGALSAALTWSAGSGMPRSPAPAEPVFVAHPSMAQAETSQAPTVAAGVPAAEAAPPSPQGASAPAPTGSQGVTPAAAGGALRSAAPRPDDEAEAKPPSRPAAATPEQAASPEPAHAERAPAATGGGPVVAPVVEPAAGLAVTADPAAPAASADGDVTLVTLPFEGNLTRMRVRIWAEPHALAVDLPGGQTPLALGRYPLGAGIASNLQLNAREGELLLRIKVRAPIASYAVTLEDGTLRVNLVRDKPPE